MQDKFGSKQNITNLPQDERPYEKCRAMGPEALSDAELLAVLLRTGTREESALQLARRLCCMSDQHPGPAGLMRCNYEQLVSIKGIGNVKALQILCIRELVKRLSRAGARPALRMTDSSTVADYFMEEMCMLEREELRLLLLDTRNRLITDLVMTRGTVLSSPVSVRDIFREALIRNAVTVILIHNHPSGDPSPSVEDINITRRIHEAGILMGVPLLDHIIIGDHCYESLKQYCTS